MIFIVHPAIRDIAGIIGVPSVYVGALLAIVALIAIRNLAPNNASKAFLRFFLYSVSVSTLLVCALVVFGIHAELSCYQQALNHYLSMTVIGGYTIGCLIVLVACYYHPHPEPAAVSPQTEEAKEKDE